MTEQRAQRRLAAILAADVVAYSRLMEADEAGTLAALKTRRRDVLDPLVAKHQGRVFKVTGDGVLVEFASAISAVQCAVDLQEAMAAANSDQPEDRHIVLRIGVNLGDVMIESGDLYGEGVNIAARLEALAEPGGILVSGTAYDHVGTKIKVGFEDIGAQTLKNIVQPVRAYRVTGTPAVAVATPKPVSEKTSIAVLPFTNMSGDPEQEYFSDGITEDIITELSRFHSLFVIARNSSFQYRGTSVDVRRVGRELGVRYVVEGSIRRLNNRVRVTAQLLEADTGAHLWGERYDRALDDIFVIQDEVVGAIVSAIPRMVGEAQVERNKRRPPAHLSAYDHVLRGEWYMVHGESTGNPHALAMFEKALAIDPECAHAHANIAYQLAYDSFRLGKRSAELLRRARLHAERAIQLDNDDATAHEIAAFVYLLCQEYDLAQTHSIQAVSINPNDRYVVGTRGLVASLLGDPRLGIEWLLKARRLDPRSFDAGREPLMNSFYLSRQYVEAIDIFRQWRNPPPHVLLDASACYAQLGCFDDAKSLLHRFESIRPDDFNIADYIAVGASMCKHQEDRDHLIEGYRKAGLPV